MITRHPYTVAQLRKLIAKAPANAIVVITGSDHSYAFGHPEMTTAMHDGSEMSEDFGEDLTPEGECGKRIPVLLIA
jgi:hypothetical protein